MKVPPKWVRRPLAYLVLYVVMTVTVLASPLLALIAIVLSHWLPGKWRALRLLGFAIVGLVLESAAVLIGFVLWVASGFGAALRKPTFQSAHYAVLGGILATMISSAQRLFHLELATDVQSWRGGETDRPLLVLSRHAGPGDSLLLANLLLKERGLKPRVVLKDTMQLDPMIDLYLNRIPAMFVDPNPRPGENMTDGIAKLARGMSAGEALLIFPEGGNFTAKRRTRAIRRLTEAGRTEAAAMASSLQHVLPPRPSGVLTALDAAGDADVVFVAHTGLDNMVSIRDIWAEIPIDKRLLTLWTYVPDADIPRTADERIEWLNGHWTRIDRWISQNNPQAASG